LALPGAVVNPSVPQHLVDGGEQAGVVGHGGSRGRRMVGRVARTLTARSSSPPRICEWAFGSGVGDLGVFAALVFADQLELDGQQPVGEVGFQGAGGGCWS
jgi:hypothetical protein